MTSTLRLKPNEDKRIRSGHLWIYSNEIDVSKTPLNSFESGQQVVLETHHGKPLGTAYVNPHSLICARLISRNPKKFLNEALLVERIERAIQWREQLFSKPFYRMIFGESDELPGLVIDRFGDVLVVQITTAGMEQLKSPLLNALEKTLNPKAILLKNDNRIRENEGMELYVEALQGTPPELVPLEENNTSFLAPIWKGQKTGWFYDHRFNRTRLADYVAHKKVLDLFSYIGGWGIQAAVAKASEVHCVDNSQPAIDLIHQNAELNQVAKKVIPLKTEAFEYLKNMKESQEKFDVIILDPPAFIKRKKDMKEGQNGYRRINELALGLLNKGGVLITASCSLHLNSKDFVDILQSAAQQREFKIQILEQGHQGPDHPIHPAIAETNYLKSFILRKI